MDTEGDDEGTSVRATACYITAGKVGAQVEGITP